MHIEVTTAPTFEPVTLAMAQAQVQVTHDADNILLTRLIKDAREVFESETGRALVTQTLEITLDASEISRFGATFVVPRRPFTSITTFKYYDTTTPSSLTAYVADTDYYTTGTDPMRIVALSGFVPLRTYKAFQLIGTAGYGNPEDVPADIRGIVLQMVADFYNNPESTQEGFAPIVTELPTAVRERILKHATYTIF